MQAVMSKPESQLIRKCHKCGLTTTNILPSGKPQWRHYRKDKTKWLCHKCYMATYYTGVKNKIAKRTTGKKSKKRIS